MTTSAVVQLVVAAWVLGVTAIPTAAVDIGACGQAVPDHVMRRASSSPT